jgi:ATP-dependent DNA helicase RecG
MPAQTLRVLQTRLFSFPRSAWECLPGRGASGKCKVRLALLIKKNTEKRVEYIVLSAIIRCFNKQLIIFKKMISSLPININDLLHFRGVESARVEFKQSWDEKTTGLQVLKTICAFANDFYNVSGGYIVIGAPKNDGVAVLGLNPNKLESIQKWIRGNCNRIEPVVQPILSPEVVDEKFILVIRVLGSDTRPHQAPVSLSDSEKAYYVRLGAETVEAKGQIRTELLGMCARVPFDDRRASPFTLNELRSTLVREFLAEVHSKLVQETDDREIYRRMGLTVKLNGIEVPRNIALLFFSDEPEVAFPGARIEVVHFPEGASGDVLQEWIFRGPLPRQIKDCMIHLKNFTSYYIQKQADRPETTGWVSFPPEALEETIVNAVFHRSYEGTREPTKVYIYPDRIEVTSYPGPVPGLERAHFEAGQRIPVVPARNRRIGEMLKELRLAEARGTGVPKVFRAMAENKSPPPRYEFDEQRTYFTVILPAHKPIVSPFQ